jgi:hypothetical protein
MSTNYYAKPVLNFPLTFTVNSYDELEELTVKVKELSKPIHLGKKSYGWNFLSSWNDGQYYYDYASYIKFIELTEWEIYDEYNNQMTKEEFIKIVTSKGKWHSSENESEKYIHFPKLDFLNGDWC